MQKMWYFWQEAHSFIAYHSEMSKSLEAYALVKMHIDAYNMKSLWYRQIVFDNDSTIKACLRHLYNDLIETGHMDKKIDQKQ